jgi:hypothetical protein
MNLANVRQVELFALKIDHLLGRILELEENIKPVPISDFELQFEQVASVQRLEKAFFNTSVDLAKRVFFNRKCERPNILNRVSRKLSNDEGFGKPHTMALMYVNERK